SGFATREQLLEHIRSPAVRANGTSARELFTQTEPATVYQVVHGDGTRTKVRYMAGVRWTLRNGAGPAFEGRRAAARGPLHADLPGVLASRLAREAGSTMRYLQVWGLRDSETLATAPVIGAYQEFLRTHPSADYTDHLFEAETWEVERLATAEPGVA